jgi:hypothetical protein
MSNSEENKYTDEELLQFEQRTVADTSVHSLSDDVGIEETILADVEAKDIRYKCYQSGLLFIHAMIPEQLELDVPELHEITFHKMTKSGERICLALPRGTSKTTLMKLSGPWHLNYTEHAYVIYVSSTHGKAANYVRDMISTMQTSNYQQIWGRIDFIIEQSAAGLYQFWMNKYSYDASGEETVKRVKVTVQCRGAAQDVRGLNIDNKRPSLGLIDDIESKESLSKGEHNYKSLKTWFMGTFEKAFDKRKKKLIQIGNLVSSPSILEDHLLSDHWESMRFGILTADGKSIWPDMWPIEDIVADYQLYLQENEIATWYAEMMNLPMPPSGGLIRIDEIQFIQHIDPQETQILYGFITVDLAISSRTWAHKTGIAVHIFTGSEWTVAQTICQVGIDPIELFEILGKLSARWRINFIGIESVAFQAALIPIYTYLAEQKKYQNLVFVPCPATNAKTERLFGWAGLLKNGTYKLPPNQQVIINQLTKYDPTKKSNDDDLIDACAHGNYMISRYSSEISKGYLDNVTGIAGSLASMQKLTRPKTNAFHI